MATSTNIQRFIQHPFRTRHEDWLPRRIGIPPKLSRQTGNQAKLSRMSELRSQRLALMTEVFDLDRKSRRADAHVDTMQEQGDGTRFLLTGHLTSGLYKGWPFRTTYDLSERAGILHATEPKAPLA